MSKERAINNIKEAISIAEIYHLATIKYLLNQALKELED